MSRTILTIHDAAKAVSYTEDHLRRVVRMGHLKAFKIGKKLLVLQKDLESWRVKQAK